MSERIKELISQAEEEQWGTNPHNGEPEFEGYVVNPEKLAEQIIKECANICDITSRKYVKLGYEVPKRCSQEIKQYFGITDENPPSR